MELILEPDGVADETLRLLVRGAVGFKADEIESVLAYRSFEVVQETPSMWHLCKLVLVDVNLVDSSWEPTYAFGVFEFESIVRALERVNVGPSDEIDIETVIEVSWL
jgi:hypothetical protein